MFLPRGWLGEERFPVAPACSCGLTGAPFEFHGVDCDRAVHPHLDEETLALVDDAVDSLACLRGSVGSDAGAALSSRPQPTPSSGSGFIRWRWRG